MRVMIVFVMVRLKENYRHRQTERGSDGNTLTQARRADRQPSSELFPVDILVCPASLAVFYTYLLLSVDQGFLRAV